MRWFSDIHNQVLRWMCASGLARVTCDNTEYRQHISLFFMAMCCILQYTFHSYPSQGSSSREHQGFHWALPWPRWDPAALQRAPGLLLGFAGARTVPCYFPETLGAFTGLCQSPGRAFAGDCCGCQRAMLPSTVFQGFCQALRGPGQSPATLPRSAGYSAGFAMPQMRAPGPE